MGINLNYLNIEHKQNFLKEFLQILQVFILIFIEHIPFLQQDENLLYIFTPIIFTNVLKIILQFFIKILFQKMETFSKLRLELDELGYTQTLKSECVPLVRKLLADLKTTTENLCKYMKISQEAIEVSLPLFIPFLKQISK